MGNLIFLIFLIVIAVVLIRFLFRVIKSIVLTTITVVKAIIEFVTNIVNWFKMRKAKKDYDKERTSFEYDYTDDDYDEAREYTARKETRRETYNEKRNRAYATLGISQSATADEIKRAYYKMAQTYHPDKYIFPEEKIKMGKVFIEVKDAYEYLVK